MGVCLNETELQRTCWTVFPSLPAGEDEKRLLISVEQAEKPTYRIRESVAGNVRTPSGVSFTIPNSTVHPTPPPPPPSHQTYPAPCLSNFVPQHIYIRTSSAARETGECANAVCARFSEMQLRWSWIYPTFCGFGSDALLPRRHRQLEVCHTQK